MSTVPAQPAFDFWKYAACSKCQLPFFSDGIVPFWLTECGHIICDLHLNADQSCAHCGSRTQLFPLHPDIPTPMSELFRSVSHAIAHAANLQQQAVASHTRALRALRARNEHGRLQIEELKRERAMLQRCGIPYFCVLVPKTVTERMKCLPPNYLNNITATTSKPIPSTGMENGRPNLPPLLAPILPEQTG
ncbi:hypothetical protein K435DRAFT_34542 [Dendrothele bispora CBS 962.96]|uniref:RING-type domain-containing protein n=1 Tax=Dendrothele bispora (strain CBS 962.96) TaxID=1314807 RepID=A0A4S8KTJ0_DENBC|nr:hypothetical protein K435DRAFT_34542 [Dendrothele bispora CBS 962.96]